ncbi:MAG: GHKL domain-containing protein [Bacteroidales bacterium]|nr:GHKL domain-containing protein [Bacteroidales bacterium]MCF8386446.1 GHKL domain-containing protein [Bacteroidales bacterium]MCF8397810.1 GHKL domain-containing protein [Bacteroidales bacterium]
MKKSFIYLIVSALLLLIATYISCFFVRQSTEEVTEELQKQVVSREKNIHDLSGQLLEAYSSLHAGNEKRIQKIAKTLEREKTEVLLFDDDSLVYWTGNKVPYEYRSYKKKLPQFVKLSNGYYQLSEISGSELSALAFILVKSNYPYQNEFLVNAFAHSCSNANEYELISNPSKNAIFNSKGEYLFSINRTRESHLVSQRTEILLFILYFAGFLFFIAFLYGSYRKFFKIFQSDLLLNITFAIDIIIIRGLLYYFKIPDILYETKLFTAHFYASSFIMSSLGDFFVNIILLLVIVLLIVRSDSFGFGKKIPGATRNLIAFLMLCISVLLYDLIVNQIQSLVLDSSIPFQLDNVFELSFAGVLSLFSIASLLMIFFLITSRFMQLYEEVFGKRYFLGLLILLVISILNFVFISEQPFIIQIFIAVYLLGLFAYFKRLKKRITVGFIIVNLLVFALITTIIINRSDKTRNSKNQELLVQKITMQENPLLEYLFEKVSDEMHESREISSLLDTDYLSDSTEDRLIRLIMKRFNDPFWQQYDVFITPCDSLKELIIEPDDYIINCREYFEGIIDDMGIETSVENLFLLDDNTIDKNYIGKIEFDTGVNNYVVFIEFYSRFIPEGLGYPELLINKASELDPFLKEHSVAKYRDGELVYKFGNYQYSINLDNYFMQDTLPAQLNRNDYLHKFYKLERDSYLVVSNKATDFFDFIAPLAYLLVTFSIYILVFLFVTRKPVEILKGPLTFRKRLQTSIISIVFVTFLFIGVLSTAYIIRINNKKTTDILTEKSHSVLIEMEHKLANIEELTPDLYPYINELLSKFSQVFFTDINLYDLSGKLVASSRPQIFEEGLISKRMDNEAMEKIMNRKKILYIHREKIGNYEYLSAYQPFRNAQKDLIAILNLPYFARQDALKDEISTFLTAFINVYLIIFVIAVILTIIISQQITKPLLLIRSKMSKLKLVQSMDKINWSSQDELGQLVDEYNRMVEALEKSAEMLARSERESAWREMAKQVAHEIKNPLTPMKLSIQHLKRIIEQKDESWEKQFKKISNTIIEQIDTLSSIASEFSDFAKMPLGQMESVDLCEILNREIELYHNSGIDISMKANIDGPCNVKADRKQIMRAFNNLIENAIQAVEGKKEPRIILGLSEYPDLYRIAVKDNGVGIEPAIMEKIFSPNFTTKSSGMGLGLAIVKSIIMESGGTIDFTSEPGSGTTFIVDLPKEKQ